MQNVTSCGCILIFKICFQGMTCYAIVEIVKIHARLYVSVIKSTRVKLAARLFYYFFSS